MNDKIEVDPTLFSEIKSSLRFPGELNEALFKRLGFDASEHFGNIVGEIVEQWQVKTLLEDVIASPEDYAIDDVTRHQQILDGAKPKDGELREIFERANQYDGPVLTLNELVCEEDRIYLLTTGEQMGQGGIHVTFIGFYTSEQEALAAADNHSCFYIL